VVGDTQTRMPWRVCVVSSDGTIESLSSFDVRVRG